MRPRIVLLALAALAVAVLVTLSIAGEFLVDILWFSSLGYRDAFVTRFAARALVTAAIGVIAFGAIYASAATALRLSGDRERLHVVRRSGDLAEITLPDLIRSFGDRVPWGLLAVAASILLAIFVALGEGANWDIYLRALYAVPFHSLDPAFGHDIGFYVFRLPLLEDLNDLFLLVIFLAAALSAALYWARGAIDFRQAPPRIEPGVIAHFSLLLGLFFVQRAAGYWLGRFGLLFHTNGVVFGLRYVDQVLWRPGLWMLMGLAIGAAALSAMNMRERGTRLLLIAGIGVFGPAILLSFVQPIIERLWVKPDELNVERPYLMRNIAMTRAAYKLGGVDVKPFAGKGRLTAASIRQDGATIDNIRLWDPRPLLATYRQLQEIRLYYDFQDIDIDRYTINGRYSQVMLSPREINPELLPESAQTWVNRHLKFTHGNGITMSPVNAKDTEGLPIFYVKDIPPVSRVGLEITQPDIYFGQEPDNYAVIKASTPEFDYPKGADNAYSYYQGEAGIPISGLGRRLLFSYVMRDINLLVTEAIKPQSRILIRRNISDRIARLVPFLNQDRDPYVVLSGGRLYWIVDCYASSDRYPYSQRSPDQINYIRNSVKAVVDAHSGATSFYIADPDDPIVNSWARIFPGLFKPLAQMPADLRSHIRYPEDLFLVQADIYRTYHMTDPQVFYNREDLWGFPRENYSGETVVMQPYYVIMRLPGEQKDEYILMLPMVPQGRDNMIAWLAARCDGADYGHLFEYAFSKDSLFYGPYQIQARVNQNPEISRQLSLWNQLGSKVILGNLIVIPLQDSLLYVEPLYIRAENGQLPELDRVIAAYRDRVVMGDDLPQTLQALFREGAPAAPVIAQAPESAGAPARQPPGAMAPGDTSAGLHTAAQLYSRAMAALKAGNWTEFGADMESLGHALEQPAPPDHK